MIPFIRQAMILMVIMTCMMMQPILAVLRNGLNFLGIAIAMIQLNLKDLNKLFVGLLLSQYTTVYCVPLYCEVTLTCLYIACMPVILM